ncbi:MAG: EamA family transporter [Candidatus Aenigmatarchaeota archaeon]|nr:EamA family transporter [Candidatus Aenigmarchaeota archaeon]
MSYDWLVLSLLSAIMAACVAILGKIGLKEVDSTLATTVRAGIMFISLLLIALFSGKLNNFQQLKGNAIIFIFFSGLAGALSWLFYFFALKLGQASKVAAIDRTSIIFVFIFALIFLGEEFNLKSFIGILFIIAGTILFI